MPEGCTSARGEQSCLHEHWNALCLLSFNRCLNRGCTVPPPNVSSQLVINRGSSADLEPVTKVGLCPAEGDEEQNQGCSSESKECTTPPPGMPMMAFRHPEPCLLADISLHTLLHAGSSYWVPGGCAQGILQWPAQMSAILLFRGS